MDRLNYSVKTPVFEGPLDLLLDLIEKRKLFVSDISLAQVTDDFIRYLETHEEFPLEESAEFILVASTLMLVKSRSLLPTLPLTEEESASIEDLELRLKLLEKTRELAGELKKIYGKDIIFEKQSSKRVAIIFSPDKKTDVNNLHRYLLAVLESLPKTESVSKATVRKVISLEEMMQRLVERISKGFKLKFGEVYKRDDKINTIVGFLAVLELVKRGALRVTQEARHGEIEIETEDLTTPNYA